jgi:hypothetical protein
VVVAVHVAVDLSPAKRSAPLGARTLWRTARSRRSRRR